MRRTLTKWRSMTSGGALVMSIKITATMKLLRFAPALQPTRTDLDDTCWVIMSSGAGFA